METQELVDRMEDMIIDTNRSLYYANGTGENIGSAIKNDIKQSGDGNSDGNKTSSSATNTKITMETQASISVM